jgi:type 1 fimbria pilin
LSGAGLAASAFAAPPITQGVLNIQGAVLANTCSMGEVDSGGTGNAAYTSNFGTGGALNGQPVAGVLLQTAPTLAAASATAADGFIPTPVTIKFTGCNNGPAVPQIGFNAPASSMQAGTSTTILANTYGGASGVAAQNVGLSVYDANDATLATALPLVTGGGGETNIADTTPNPITATTAQVKFQVAYRLTGAVGSITAGQVQAYLPVFVKYAP